MSTNLGNKGNIPVFFLTQKNVKRYGLACKIFKESCYNIKIICRHMKKIFLFLMGGVLMMAIGMSSCSSSDDNMDNSKEYIELILSNIDKNTTYPVSEAVCWTDGLTSNYKSPSFYCLINDAPGLTSLYIHYKYYNNLENRNNFFLEDIKAGDILDSDDFMAELFYPMNIGYDRHTFVATSGKIQVIDKKGEGKNLTLTLQFNNLRFTETSSIESGARPLPRPYNVNGIIKFEYTEKR